MAALFAAILVGATSEGIERMKTKRTERKEQQRQRKSSADSVPSASSDSGNAKGFRFAESKAREASAERHRKVEEEQAELDANSPVQEAGTHPALRDPGQIIWRTRPVDEAPPPPYVKDAPPYEENTQFGHTTFQSQPRHTSGPL